MQIWELGNDVVLDPLILLVLGKFSSEPRSITRRTFRSEICEWRLTRLRFSMQEDEK